MVKNCIYIFIDCVILEQGSIIVFVRTNTVDAVCLLALLMFLQAVQYKVVFEKSKKGKSGSRRTGIEGLF